MHKFASYSVTLFVALGITIAPVIAQTTGASNAASLIAQLQSQIQALKGQIDALHAAQNQVASSTANVTGTLQLIRSLSEGMTGDDVKALQAALSADPDVYPEGLISGYFGRLTSSAVKRFQKKHGIEQLGRVGPRTLKELNKFFNLINKLKLEDDDNDEDNDNDRHEKKPCALVPPGHLIAPGWLRKNGEDRENLLKSFFVRPCRDQGLSTPPTSADVTSPNISNVIATDITHISAKIKWITNENSTSKVWYGTTTPIAITNHTPKSTTSGLVISHEVALSGLIPSTSYRYLVVSQDASGNTATSSESSFVTSATPDTTAPNISGINVNNLSQSGATVNWTTNEAATSKVWYGTTTPVAISLHTAKASVSGLSTSHSVNLSGLTASSTYFFLVNSADTSSNSATSTESHFATTN